MSEIDWPAGFERTPAAEREPDSPFRVSLAETSSEIRTELDRMDADDWRASTASGGAYTKRDGLPKHNANPDDPGFVLRWTDDGENFAVACDHYADLRDNARTVYRWVHETRKRSQRPVETGSAEFAAARLPSGDDDAVVVAGEIEAPHEVLNVGKNAPDAVVEAAARRLKAENHPDSGGSREAFQRIVNAEEAMLSGGGDR